MLISSIDTYNHYTSLNLYIKYLKSYRLAKFNSNKAAKFIKFTEIVTYKIRIIMWAKRLHAREGKSLFSFVYLHYHSG